VSARVRIIKELVRDSLYQVEEREIADAILARATLRRVVAEPSFRSEPRGLGPRSFRRDRDARSFRLSGGPRLRRAHH
jgi:hypothetical protein